MKKHRNIITGLVGIGAVLLVASTVLFAQINYIDLAWTNENVCLVSTNIWNDQAWAISTAITIGPVTIDTTNGAVTIDEGVTMDEASREFWRALERTYPACFPSVNAGNQGAVAPERNR